MLNENIRTLRKSKGISQEELAARLHVVRQTVSKWEKGLSVPDAGMLIQIAEALGTTVNVLLGEAVPEPEADETIRALAEKLEALNEQLARRTERWRRLLFAASALLALLVLGNLTKELLGFYHLQQVEKTLSSTPAIIGGTDTATSIYVSSISPQTWSILLTAGGALLSTAGLLHFRKK